MISRYCKQGLHGLCNSGKCTCEVCCINQQKTQTQERST